MRLRNHLTRGCAVAVIGLAVLFAGILTAPAATNNADTITLGWTAPSEPDVAGYRLYFGQDPNLWTHAKEVASTNITVSLPTAGTWYFIVTATNLARLESEPSNLLVYTTPTSPGPPGALRLLSAIATRISTITTTTNLIFVP